MKILNLTNPTTSDIKFEVSRFPDGQQQVKIVHLSFNVKGYLFSVDDKPEITEYDKVVTIKSRLNDFKDLELIICATASLRQLGVKEIHLYTPYFLGSRSDRQFEEGSNNYLKHVISPLVNFLGFESVTVLDPHSDVLEACLNGFKKVSNRSLVEYALSDLNIDTDKFILISPDAGASKKIHKIAEQIGYKGDIVICSKERDEKGKLTDSIVPFKYDHLRKNYIIIDDICDGGATFINIGKSIKKYHDNDPNMGKIYLMVTHGIFSKGLGELQQYFDAIYTTNSYKELKECAPFIKQLNVF